MHRDYIPAAVLDRPTHQRRVLDEEKDKSSADYFYCDVSSCAGMPDREHVQDRRVQQGQTSGELFGQHLFSPADSSEEGVFVNASARDSTWTKCFDLNNEGLTEHNYQAYTYDVTITDNTTDEVSDYTFRLEFGTKVFLSSAWNGKLEIHQNVVDSFDAMNTDRVYRKKLSKEKIISELENNKGLQFDPKIADVMLELLNDNAIKIE